MRWCEVLWIIISSIEWGNDRLRWSNSPSWLDHHARPLKRVIPSSPPEPDDAWNLIKKNMNYRTRDSYLVIVFLIFYCKSNIFIQRKNITCNVFFFVSVFIFFKGIRLLYLVWLWGLVGRWDKGRWDLFRTTSTTSLLWASRHSWDSICHCLCNTKTMELLLCAPECLSAACSLVVRGEWAVVAAVPGVVQWIASVALVAVNLQLVVLRLGVNLEVRILGVPEVWHN